MKVIEPDWPAPAAVRALVTTRSGGVSRGPYQSLNLADHVGDAAAAVASNRQRLRDALGLPGTPCWLRQVHGAQVLDLPSETADGADAAVTRVPSVVCAVLTADCLPVLLARTDGAAVGVAHAGWRGLAAGVLANTVASLGGSPAGLTAWLGPRISAPAYEVGDEVRDALVTADPAHARGFERNASGRWQADLGLLGRLTLEGLGVAEIHEASWCTFTDPRFFSHRREAPCGRMATLIWLEK